MTYRTINPATGETVRTFGDISDADLDNAVEAARSCYVVETEEAAIDVANATPFGLGASVFTGDVDRGRRVARQLVNAAPAGAPPWGPVPVP